MIRIIHVSDLHFESGALLTSKPHDQDALARRLLENIHARHFANPATAAYLLVTGDLVDDATEAQYQAAAQAMAPFAGRLLACPGNHCVSRLGNIFDPGSLDRWRKYIAPLCLPCDDQTDHMPTETWLDDRGGTRAMLLGLNSCSYSATSLACGELGEAQREALMSLLNRAAFMDWPTVVYLHHRPFGFGPLDGIALRLKDGPELVEIVDGVVDAVCYGHSGGGVELPFGLPLNSATNLHGTHHLDANASVRTGSYFEIAVDGTDVRVTEMRIPL